MNIVLLSWFQTLLLVSNNSSSPSPSKWVRRTARKRQQTQELLDSVPLPPLLIHKNAEFTSPMLLQAPELDWAHLPAEWDPQQGGKLREGSLRALRKRRQVEAFYYVSNRLLQGKGQTIIDAGCGAGNLAIPLAGLLSEQNHKVVAIDVNPMAMSRLLERAPPNVQGICTDLAFSDTARMPAMKMDMVVSLHACGAATDLAIRLATSSRVPYCVSPCCTAKAVMDRQDEKYGPTASSQRSSAPNDLNYPRSAWLRNALKPAETISAVSLETCDDIVVKKGYQILAKVADVGLGPQTPLAQIEHQQRAKLLVEWDRLMETVENHNYSVGIFHLKDHDEFYGKKELLVGVPNENGMDLKKMLSEIAD